MKLVLQPWQLMLIMLVSSVNRKQQSRIEYLQSEVAVLKEHIGKKRILLTDEQRRRLAVKGKMIGHKALVEAGSLLTPDTILRWHRQLVASKWDYSDRKEQKPGRPRIRQVIVDLTVKFAKENPIWGYDRMSGAVSNFGYHICDSTIGNILKAHSIEPVPNRKRTGSWGIFLKSHYNVMAAIDFATVEVWTKGGFLLRSAIGLACFFGIAALPGLNLDRESGSIHSRNFVFRQPKCSFQYFAPTAKRRRIFGAVQAMPSIARSWRRFV